MTILEIWLLAIALAMDCFTVSITSGLFLKKIAGKPLLTMAFFFGLFQAMMPLIGWLGANYFNQYIEHFDHWIAFGLLAFLGGRMIWEGTHSSGEECHFNPCQLKAILTMAIATSIDALAIGISFSCTGMTTLQSILLPILIIGIVSFLFSILGNFIGIFIGKRFRLPVEPIGGIILILIGCKIVVEHLGIL